MSVYLNIYGRFFDNFNLHLFTMFDNINNIIEL